MNRRTEKPLYDVIIGNVPGAQETVSAAEVHACDELKEVEETQAAVTRAQAEKEHKVKLLKVTESIDCNLSTEEDIGLGAEARCQFEKTVGRNTRR